MSEKLLTEMLRETIPIAFRPVFKLFNYDLEQD